ALWDGQHPPDPNDTISYLQYYIALFHNSKEAFLKYRASKAVKKDAAIFAAGSVPVITLEEEATMSRAEVAVRKKADGESRKALVEQYKMEHSSYNMPKVHLMKHFSKVMSEFSELQAFSTSIVELNH